MSVKAIENDDLWAERGDYWLKKINPTPQYKAKKRRVLHKPLVLSGHGIKLNIDRHTLLIKCGFTHYPQKREEYRFFPSDRQLPSRIVILDGDGSVTFNALEWLSEQKIPLVQIDWQGNLSSIGGANYSADNDIVYHQLYMQQNSRSFEFSKELIKQKINNSIKTIKTISNDDEKAELAINKINEQIELLNKSSTNNISQLLSVEGNAAFYYFRYWQNIPLRWRGLKRKPVPPEWLQIGTRIGKYKSNQLATTPINAVLNYVYAVLENQVKGQRQTRGDRKKGKRKATRRGFFIDIRTLAFALTSTPHSLNSLAKTLGVKSQKHQTDEHGKDLTLEYIEYAIQDTQTTWECFVKLKELYKTHNLKLTPAHKICSEASLGKAYLKDMAIKPWRIVQPDFSPELIGNIMSSYYGGRSEVHIRKENVQVLYCDFLSMYPTVCTLMGLWRYVISQGVEYRDTTKETKEFIDNINIDDLQNQDTWKKLTTIVQVIPDSDIFPIRAKYGGDAQYTIGLNHLTCDMPVYYTLADCISSKLLTGKTPRIIKAITFYPKDIQEGLKSIDIAGKPEYHVNPIKDDLFRKVIDLRCEIKKAMKASKSENEKEQLKEQQLALKILANSTSYGIFVE